MEKTVAFHTLGCRVNQSETASLAALFTARGYRVVDWDQAAGVYVINTCTVTGAGDKKSRQAVRQAVRKNPAAVVVVTGCYAEVAPEEIAALPGVKLVVGHVNRTGLVDLVEGTTPRVLTGVDLVPAFCELPVPAAKRTRAFLKVQEGCNRFCSYCIVPLARGRERSLPPDRVLAQARALVEAGHREIVVTGTNTGAYGRDLGGPGYPDLAGLLESLARVEGLARIRLSSVEPEEVTDRLIAVLAGYRKFCRHLHLPLQSGDDAVLKAMGRRYTAADFRRLVRSLKTAVPGLSITADVLTGFPGEDQAAHRNTCLLVEEEELAGLHVFKYSPRRRTAAFALGDQVDAAVKEERSRELLALGRMLSQRFASSLTGQVVEVLVEEAATGGLYTGFTDTYVRVFFPAGPRERGRVARVAVEGFGTHGLTGRIYGGSNNEKSV